MALECDVVRNGMGHWVFIATEDGNRYELVHPEKFTPFTEAQKHAMKLDAMSKFAGYEIRVIVDNAPRPPALPGEQYGRGK